MKIAPDIQHHPQVFMQKPHVAINKTQANSSVAYERFEHFKHLEATVPTPQIPTTCEKMG